MSRSLTIGLRRTGAPPLQVVEGRMTEMARVEIDCAGFGSSGSPAISMSPSNARALAGLLLRAAQDFDNPWCERSAVTLELED